MRGRDGCRVPIPWTRTGPSYGFGDGDPWLPQPASWSDLSVEAQAGVDGSVLELYRSALRLRRGEAAFGDGALRWLESPPDVLLFERTGGEGSDAPVVCAVNIGADAVPLPAYDEVLLTSAPLTSDGELPADTSVWLRVR